MDQICSRFPILGKEIFDNLESKSLVRCTEVNRQWSNFLDEEKIYWIRIINNFIDNQNDFIDSWKSIIHRTPAEIIKNLGIMVKNFCPKSVNLLRLDERFKVERVSVESQFSPLHIAAKLGDVNLTKFIIEKVKHENPKLDFMHPWTPLYLAAVEGHSEVCKEILEAVNDDIPVNELVHDLTPIHAAAFKGHLSVCKTLIDYLEDKNPKLFEGCTPLHLAAVEGHHDVYQAIMENIADKNPAAKYGVTPLWLAASTRLTQHHKLCEIIVKNVKNKNPKDWDGQTPLHMAASLGNLEGFKIIFDSVVDKNPSDNKGMTPLHEAASGWSWEYSLFICRYILESDEVIDKNPQDEYGRTPLHFAAECGAFAEYKNIMYYAEDKNPKDIDGVTPLHLAAAGGHPELCEYIMDNVMDKNPRDISGDTPSHMAAKCGGFTLYHTEIDRDENNVEQRDVEVCEIIFNSIEDTAPSKGNPNGLPSIHLGVEYGSLYKYRGALIKNKDPKDIDNPDIPTKCRHLEAFEVILEKTKDAYPKNNDGKTPLDIAAEGGNLQAYIASYNNLLGITKNLYFCGICDDQFASIGELTKHISTVHEKKEPKNDSTNKFNMCTVCEDNFAEMEELIKHISEVHEEEEPQNDSTKKSYLCAICEDDFAEMEELTKHISAVHEEKKPPNDSMKNLYLCTICQDSFVCIDELMQHVSEVHGVHHELVPRLKKPRLEKYLLVQLQRIDE